ncbi:gag-polypeptide of LTR copia-type [Sesbania bispinosa]|nr:gag-polypeptide of LTR copia-type [Sesbania bispinosa]
MVPELLILRSLWPCLKNLNRSLHWCVTLNPIAAFIAVLIPITTFIAVLIPYRSLHCSFVKSPSATFIIVLIALMAEIVNPTPETEDKSLTVGELQNIHSAYWLNGKNYLKWSQLINSMIMTWLWNSMIPEINDTCMFLKLAKEIWEAVEQTYSKDKDVAQIYKVKVKTMGAKQGNKSVTEYANQLKSLWVELDRYRFIKTRCSEDSTILKEYIEQDRVYDFLVGLNPEYDQVRIQILGKEKVPELNEVIAIVRSEESDRELMLETPTTESSTMIAEGGIAMVANKKKSRFHNMEKKHGEVWCTYCKKSRHTREKCWKLHGKPPSREWGRKGGPKKRARASTHC